MAPRVGVVPDHEPPHLLPLLLPLPRMLPPSVAAAAMEEPAGCCTFSFHGKNKISFRLFTPVAISLNDLQKGSSILKVGRKLVVKLTNENLLVNERPEAEEEDESNQAQETKEPHLALLLCKLITLHRNTEQMWLEQWIYRPCLMSEHFRVDRQVKKIVGNFWWTPLPFGLSLPWLNFISVLKMSYEKNLLFLELIDELKKNRERKIRAFPTRGCILFFSWGQEQLQS